MEQLREVARELSVARDAHVKLKALQSVTSSIGNELSSHQLRYFRESLHRDFQRATWSFTKEKTPARVERALKKVGRELDQLQLAKKGWNALCPGIRLSYCEGAKFAPGKKATSEDLHEWRKRIKDLWYQIRLLSSVWPEQMEALAEELKILSEYLGDDHDLTLLEQSASEFCQRDGKAEEWTLLKAMIDLRRDELRKKAFVLGARFYAEKPSAFCKRLSRYWQIWRHKKRQHVQVSDKLHFRR
jgi:CHAD domain-containing protein